MMLQPNWPASPYIDCRIQGCITYTHMGNHPKIGEQTSDLEAYDDLPNGWISLLLARCFRLQNLGVGNSPRDDRIKVEDTHDEGRKIEDLDLEVLIVTMGASMMDTTQKRDSIDREREREKERESHNKIGLLPIIRA